MVDWMRIFDDEPTHKTDSNMDQIKIAFQQSELDYLDAIESLQKECGMTGKEAEALVELWDEDSSTLSSQNLGTENG